MLNSRLSVQANRLVRSTPTPGRSNVQRTIGKANIQANGLDVGFGPPMAGGAPMSTMGIGGPAFNTMFMGILPEYNENLLLSYYRDCYYYDSVGGATVDIISSFPFSEWTLAGIENDMISKYSESLARLNMRSLLQEISNAYLVDSAFIGSLVYDPKSKIFQDILIHDFANASVTPQPFYSIDPVISVNSTNALNQFLNAGSPFVNETLANYPKALINTFLGGSTVLDPLTTLYLPRKGMQDRTSASYLKRLLPVYMLEKILFRGTLTEAQKRLRSTSHIQVGDETWEPNNAEMASILGDFQRSELDPLGAWIVTRQGVQVNEVRPGGDFWKWTDNIDTLTPFKLRALGISEAFLSGDASYATAEAAVSVFLENMEAYRKFLTYKLFTSKIFPLIAVLNGMYKDPSKAREVRNSGDLQYNLNNQNNLYIPEVHWHKSLEGKDSDSDFDMLEKLSEKGFSIPLKMWASAAGVDINMMLRDLKEDQEIKEKIEKVTGIKVERQGQSEGQEADEDGEDMRFSAMHPGNMGSRPASVAAAKRSVPLLARDFDPVSARLNKSGSGLHAVNETKHSKRVNELIIKASRALQDPNHRASMRKKVQEKLGAGSNLNLIG